METQHAHTVGTREACDNAPAEGSSSVGGAAHAVGSPALDRVVGVLVAAHLRNPAGRQAVSHGEARRTPLPRPQDTDTHGTAASVRGAGGRDLPVAERVQLREVSQVVEVRDHVEHGCLMRPGRTPQSVSVTASARHAQSASLLHTRAEIDRADRALFVGDPLHLFCTSSFLCSAQAGPRDRRWGSRLLIPGSDPCLLGSESCQSSRCQTNTARPRGARSLRAQPAQTARRPLCGAAKGRCTSARTAHRARETRGTA